jgi:hypothetical protein
MTTSVGPPHKIAVVGHTNTGKTSLMRTLMRDVEFGEVSNRPATTRRVEGAALTVGGKALIELYDTPGLEDSIALLDHLSAMKKDRRDDGVAVVQQFLASKDAASGAKFSQEAKALRQVLAGDLALYVIDVRDRVLGKHRDELEILSWCARPVVPVLNFIASPEARTAEWREHLSRVNLHAVAEFDTIVLNEEGERRLYEKMRTLLDAHHATFDALIDQRRVERTQLVSASARLVADMLLDAAAFVMVVPFDASADIGASVERMKQIVRDREQQCVEHLLALHRFRPEDCAAVDLPLSEGRWGFDPFSPAAMKQLGVRTTSSAAAGALAGLTIDAMVGGLSLGAGAAIGAAIGAALGTGQLHGRRLLDRMRGRSELRCDDSTLKLLMMRQVWLVKTLIRRGHASVDPIRINDSREREMKGMVGRELPDVVDEARNRPQWSSLRGNSTPGSGNLADWTRTAALDRLTKSVHRLITSKSREQTSAIHAD